MTSGQFLNVLQGFELAVLVLAIVVLVRDWKRRRSATTGWALAVFGDLALIISVSYLPVEQGPHVFTTLLICVLLLIPFLLLGFAYSLGAVGSWQRRIGLGLTVTQLVWAFLAPPFPKPGEHRPTWVLAFLVLILVSWTLQSVLTAVGLFRAGIGQPAVVRNRMRSLGTGAVLIALVLIAGSGSSSSSSDVGTGQVVRQLISGFAICLLVLAFVVPNWLRAAWRASDLTELGLAERQLMVAVTPEDVASAIVPAVVRLFGASGAALLGPEGVMAAIGSSVTSVSVSSSDPVSITASGAFACRLSDGWLVLEAGQFAPLFGPAEFSLLERIGSFTDLAMRRCRLFAQEARSRAAAEAANAELQTLVYSVSHDLRNPIISVLGYVDVLAEEGVLKGESARYLERISVNALYMQNLIQDLLELSRIGRTEPPPTAVALGPLAQSVAEEVSSQHPAVAVTVTGPFPVVWMSELRARQLLTNLIDNAAKHGARSVAVTVFGRDLLVADDGPGIPAHLREKAFEVFERLDAAHGMVPGTGMGLPICKRIVESWDGTISLSGPLNGPHGTTVRVALPAGITTLPLVEKELTP